MEWEGRGLDWIGKIKGEREGKKRDDNTRTMAMNILKMANRFVFNLSFGRL